MIKKLTTLFFCCNLMISSSIMAILTECEVFPPLVGAREVMGDVLKSAKENVGWVDTCKDIIFTVDEYFFF